MATASPSVRSRRRPVRAVAKVQPEASQSTRLLAYLNTPAAKTAFVVIGTAGLAALALAIVGPQKLEKQVFRPLRDAIEPQAEKLWAEAKPLRRQFAELFQNATPTGREKLVRSFQSWIGHFHAT